jgi:tol-pal system protein YbgF
MRELRGKIEETQNSVQKVAGDLDKFQKDTEFRLNQPPVAAPAAAAAAGAPKKLGTLTVPAPAAPSADAPATPAAPAAASADADPSKKAPPALKTNFPTPRDHYNYAFRLLNQTQYEQAASSFDDFTNKYPKDPLIGNAYYWGGETYYIRRDYVKAADYFRLGYEAMPEGPKAADNLYKLALTLNSLDQGKEACVVLQQVVAKFKKTATNITAKAEQEIKNSGCRTKQ